MAKETGRVITKIPIEDLMNLPLLEEHQKGDTVLTIYDALVKIKSILNQEKEPK